MVTIQTVELDVVDFPAPKGDFLNPYIDWDQNNFQHEIYVRQEGTNIDDSTRLFYVKKNAQGQVVDSAVVQPRVDVNGKPMKFISVTGVVKVIPPGQNVATIVVSFSIHGAGPNNGRRAARGYHKIPGVYAPHARGEREDELFDVVLPDGEPAPAPGGSGLTDEDKTWLTGQLAPLVRTQQFGDGGVRTGLMEKVTDGLLWMLDPNNNDPKARAFRFLLGYRQIGDRSYEAATNAIRDWGIPHGAGKAAADVAQSDADEIPPFVQEALAQLHSRLAEEQEQEEAK